MKSAHAVLISVLLVLACACARKVNEAVDVKAIKDSAAEWDRAWNAGDAEAVASLYASDAIAMAPNESAIVGKDAIRSSSEKYFERFKDENRSIVEDVRVAGNLVFVRGTQETKTTPKSGGQPILDKAKWLTAYERQADGSWKILWEMFNSDLPAPDCLPGRSPVHQ